jgi:hypothetical protein
MTEPYRPRLEDDVEIFKGPNGGLLKKVQMIRGRVTGLGTGIREGRIRVTFKVTWGQTSGWYRPEQLRLV